MGVERRPIQTAVAEVAGPPDSWGTLSPRRESPRAAVQQERHRPLLRRPQSARAAAAPRVAPSQLRRPQSAKVDRQMQVTTASLELRRGPLAANLRASEAGMSGVTGGRWAAAGSGPFAAY
jgi:hypothetical protein